MEFNGVQSTFRCGGYNLKQISDILDERTNHEACHHKLDFCNILKQQNKNCQKTQGNGNRLNQNKAVNQNNPLPKIKSLPIITCSQKKQNETIKNCLIFFEIPFTI